MLSLSNAWSFVDMGYCDDWKQMMDDREGSEAEVYQLDCNFTWIVGNVDPTTQVTTAWEVIVGCNALDYCFMAMVKFIVSNLTHMINLRRTEIFLEDASADCISWRPLLHIQE